MANASIISSIAGATPGLVVPAVSSVVDTVYSPPTAIGYSQWLEQGSGATQRNFRRWIGLPGAGVSRATLEDFGYDASQPVGQTIKRYAQYKPVANCVSTATSTDSGEICLNWGLLDAARSGLLTAANTPGGVFAPVGGITINAGDLVWFFPQIVPAANNIGAPTVASIQPGVGFTLGAAITAGETWRYLVVAGPPA